MQRGIFKLDFYGDIKSICWEWLNLCSVIRSLYNFEHVKVTINEAECVLIQVSVSSLLSNWWQCFICCVWMALLAQHICYMAQIAAVTQNLLCPEMSVSCFKVLGTESSHFLPSFPKPTLSCEICLVCPRSDCASLQFWTSPEGAPCGQCRCGWGFMG